jgi:hypothetical protein
MTLDTAQRSSSIHSYSLLLLLLLLLLPLPLQERVRQQRRSTTRRQSCKIRGRSPRHYRQVTPLLRLQGRPTTQRSRTGPSGRRAAAAAGYAACCLPDAVLTGPARRRPRPPQQRPRGQEQERVVAGLPPLRRRRLGARAGHT